MTGSAVRALFGLLTLLLACGFQQAPAASPFSDWGAVVVAADWRASNGKPTAAFENARRDLSKALLDVGFRPENLRSYGIDAKAPGVGELSRPTLTQGMAEIAGRTSGGCLLYLTSHGSPEGVIFGREGVLAPRVLGRLLDETCGGRPTVAFISACFSGVFVPALAGPNRLVVTAARRDRTSFGCGEDDVYPFFDGCVLENMPRSADFLALGRAVRTCVGRREAELRLAPASEPQISVGGRIGPMLPLYPLQSVPAP
jgi:hypothetical protein